VNAQRNDQNVKVDHPYFSTPGEPLLHSGGRPPAQSGARLDWRQALGVVLIAGGLISLIIGYVGISGTTQTYDQLTYFMSNGIGGAAAIILGSTVLVIREHVADRQAMQQLDERLTGIDRRLPAEAARRGETRPEPGAHAKAAAHNGAVSNSASVQTA
jgi:hypothetical protein